MDNNERELLKTMAFLVNELCSDHIEKIQTRMKENTDPDLVRASEFRLGYVMSHLVRLNDLADRMMEYDREYDDDKLESVTEEVFESIGSFRNLSEEELNKLKETIKRILKS